MRWVNRLRIDGYVPPTDEGCCPRANEEKRRLRKQSRAEAREGRGRVINLDELIEGPDRGDLPATTIHIVVLRARYVITASSGEADCHGEAASLPAVASAAEAVDLRPVQLDARINPPTSPLHSKLLPLPWPPISPAMLRIILVL